MADATMADHRQHRPRPGSGRRPRRRRGPRGAALGGPGAEHALDITIDRAEIFEILAAKLTDFREHGGGTIVDSTGMFHGRDVTPVRGALACRPACTSSPRPAWVPRRLLGGYFLTPQTDPPTPWPAEKFADLFGREVTEGMVVPRVERRGAAGLVATTATRGGMTATDESLFRGAARAALATGVPVSLRYGADALARPRGRPRRGAAGRPRRRRRPRPGGRRRAGWPSPSPSAAPTSRSTTSA